MSNPATPVGYSFEHAHTMGTGHSRNVFECKFLDTSQVLTCGADGELRRVYLSEGRYRDNELVGECSGIMHGFEYVPQMLV